MTQLNKDNIHDLIRQGENAAMEFKRSDTRSEKIAREMVAFSNTHGGIILLGVSDNGEIEGLGQDKNYEEWLVNIARTSVLPSISIEIHEIIIDDKPILAIQIPKGKDKPYQALDGRYYIRVGSTNRMTTQPELMRLFQASGVFHYDLTPVSGTDLNDLNFAKLDDYFQKYHVEFSKDTESQKKNILENTDILSKTGEVTLGGLLVFGNNPSRYLHQNGISFACFNGNTINEILIDKKNIEGDLCQQVDLCVSVIKTLIPNPSRIVSTKREDTTHIYSDKVFRELITNAMVHRNYAITGSKTRVFLFRNRLEVISPGRLPNTVTIEKLPYGVSFASNPVLVKFMENLRYIDQLGRGLPMVYKEAVSRGKNVLFEELGEEFKVTLEL